MFAPPGKTDKPIYDSLDVRALVWHGPHEMTIEDYLGLMPNRVPPLVMGHEFAGVVTRAGVRVDARWLGKRVAVNPIDGCGQCLHCTAGRRNLCPARVRLASPGRA